MKYCLHVFDPIQREAAHAFLKTVTEIELPAQSHRLRIDFETGMFASELNARIAKADMACVLGVIRPDFYGAG